MKKIILFLLILFSLSTNIFGQLNHIEMVFKLKNDNGKNTRERLEKILQIMRYRIASFKMNETVSGIRNNRIYINIPQTKYQNRIKAVLEERGTISLYEVTDEVTDKTNQISREIKYRFGSEKIHIIGDPIFTNHSVKDLKVAELSDGSFLLVIILNPFAAKKLAYETKRLIGKQVALIISDRWINVVTVKDRIVSGQVAFPINYPLETAMTMLSVISLGAYPESIECESIYTTEAPFKIND